LVVTEGKELKWYKINDKWEMRNEKGERRKEKWLVTCDFRLFLLPL
jgi:hypothetical protein